MGDVVTDSCRGRGWRASGRPPYKGFPTTLDGIPIGWCLVRGRSSPGGPILYRMPTRAGHCPQWQAFQAEPGAMARVTDGVRLAAVLEREMGHALERCVPKTGDWRCLVYRFTV